MPADLLKAVGFAETGWQMVRGEAEFPGQPRAFGVMALRGAHLERGAALAGVPAKAARSRPDANIRAAAAVLASLADELGISRADYAPWAAEGQADYVHRGVYGDYM